MSLQRTHYEVFGISRGATPAEIKQKYRDLARKYHPDLAEDKILGQKLFTQVNQSYRVLIDPEKRAEYDSTLGLTKPGPGSSRSTGSPAQSSARPSAPIRQQSVSQQAVPSAPSPEMIRILGDAERCLIEGKYSQAKNITEKIIKIDSRNAKAYCILGDALANLKETEKASAAYRQSLEITPSSLVQAKLIRLFEAAAGPWVESNNGSSSRRPVTAGGPSSGSKATATRDKPAGLFSRLLGRK